jgi:serine/threonine protein phosphatase 1
MKSSCYVIGDVHGCYYTLLELLEKIPKDSRVIFVGDLCDRGLYSKEVIDLVINNNYEAVLGNHEDFMIKHFKDFLNKKPNRWYDNPQIGGKDTIESYKGNIEKLSEHIKYLKSLPLYIQIDKYFITHGLGLPYYKRKDSNDKAVRDGIIKARLRDEETKWGKEWEENWREYDLVNIFGHTHNDKVVIGPNYYCIDTGCVYGGKLTAMELPTMKTIDVVLNQKDKNKGE